MSEPKYQYAHSVDGKRTDFEPYFRTSIEDWPAGEVAMGAEQAAEDYWRGNWPDTDEAMVFHLWKDNVYLGYCGAFPYASFRFTETDDPKFFWMPGMDS